MKNKGVDTETFDRKNRIKKLINVEEEVMFMLKANNKITESDEIYIMAEREESLWILNDTASFNDGWMKIVPQP